MKKNFLIIVLIILGSNVFASQPCDHQEWFGVKETKFAPDRVTFYSDTSEGRLKRFEKEDGEEAEQSYQKRVSQSANEIVLDKIILNGDIICVKPLNKGARLKFFLNYKGDEYELYNEDLDSLKIFEIVKGVYSPEDRLGSQEGYTYYQYVNFDDYETDDLFPERALRGAVYGFDRSLKKFFTWGTETKTIAEKYYMAKDKREGRVWQGDIPEGLDDPQPVGLEFISQDYCYYIPTPKTERALGKRVSTIAKNNPDWYKDKMRAKEMVYDESILSVKLDEELLVENALEYYQWDPCEGRSN